MNALAFDRSRDCFRSIGGHPVELLCFVPIGPSANDDRLPQVARCATCTADIAHPTARTCEKVGCPIKHLTNAFHDFAGAA